MLEYLEFAKKIAKHAGSIMKEYFELEDQGTEFKSDRTPVTEADKKINSYLIEQVKKEYPLFGVNGEEEKYYPEREYVWVCDPIDGTSQFTRKVPVSMFSLALVFKGEVLVGVTYDPFLDEMFTAIKGEGAYCNGKRIHVNQKKLGELGCSIDYCMWDKAKYDTLEIVKEIRSLSKTCQVGSTVHASMLVARGRISAEIFPGTSHGNCDMAASKLIVEEAGGKVTSFHGHDQKYNQDIDGAILSNGVVHEKLISIILDLEQKGLL